MLEQITQMLQDLGPNENPNRLPATHLYNEGWMLRLILHAVQQGHLKGLIDPSENWFSEGQLRSPFGRKKGTPYEKNTHADGVVGNFTTENKTKSAIQLDSDANHFCVYEAKMFSGLSPGTKNAPDYNQAARTVACMAHTLEKADRSPLEMKKVGFFVVAPREQIKKSIFDDAMNADLIREAIEKRIEQFSDEAYKELKEWQSKWFEPLLEKMVQVESLDCIAWEDLIGRLTESQDLISNFYRCCYEQNPQAKLKPTSTSPERSKFYEITEGKLKGKTVVVCFTGSQRSRVYQLGKRQQPFLVSNEHLQPVEEKMAAPHSPQVNWEYQYKDDNDQEFKVKVLNTGPCNSRVIKVDIGQDETSFLVPNHFLEEIK